MKKVLMIDYKGNANRAGVPIGHPIKVINEFSQLLQYHCKVKLLIPENYKDYIKDVPDRDVHWLSKFMNIEGISFFDRIANFFNRVINIRESLNCFENEEIIWFVNADIVLFVYMFFSPTSFKNKKIWLTLYDAQVSNKRRLKRFFLKKTLVRFNAIFESTLKADIEGINTYQLPDYIYYPEYYEKYNNANKIDRVLYVGTISDDKDIEGLVEAFYNSDKQLLIAGKFRDPLKFQYLKDKASENITFKNSYITEEEYYKLIAESKYIILPYKMEGYMNRTSGVLMEAIYLDSIPIAPKYLLEFNNTSGIEYLELRDVNKMIDTIRKEELDRIINNNFGIKESNNFNLVLKKMKILLEN